MNYWCSHITLHVNGPKTYHNARANFPIQCGCQTSNFVCFAIPKFYISAHRLNCQSNFSFNYQPYMACTDGEDPECWWAHINPMSMSTKEMGPRAWLDTLDDYADTWNWQKITGFGECFKLVIDRFVALILFYSIYIKVLVSWACLRRPSQCHKGRKKIMKILLQPFQARLHGNGK
jgi:KDZ transposase-like protein